jgi:hypothetical protein
MATYEVVGSVTGLKVGDRVTDEQLKKDHAALSVDKLLRTGAIKHAEGPATSNDDEKALREANYNTGSPLPLREDMDQKEAIAINLGQGAPDAAERAHPRRGGPGAVQKRGAEEPAKK